MDNWIMVTDKLPPLDESVWLYDESTGDIWIGARRLEHYGWAWARSYGTFWWSGRTSQWEGDCITDAGLHPSHWAPLITPPSRAVGDK